MPQCKHESLEYIGEQRSDKGVNAYFWCTKCWSLIVTTPERTVFSVAGMKRGAALATTDRKANN